MHRIPVDSALFDKRAKRIKYLAEHFGRYLNGWVLDVGCDTTTLRDMLPAGSSYTGIDIGGNPDITLNLEEIERLPFDGKAFDTVVCTDVLKHLDNLHAVFAELVRVSNRYVIRALLRLFTPNRECYLNRYAHTLWAVLEKQ